MEKANIDAARAQATSVLGMLSPLVKALEQAGEVLSVASNSAKLKSTLASEVDALKNEAITLHESVTALTLRKKELTAEVQAVEAQAREQARLAAQATQEQVQAAERLAQERVAAAQAAAAAKEAAFTQHIQDVQKATDAEVAALFTKQQTAAEAAAAAEKRLATIQAQAQKFAASLGG